MGLPEHGENHDDRVEEYIEDQRAKVVKTEAELAAASQQRDQMRAQHTEQMQRVAAQNKEQQAALQQQLEDVNHELYGGLYSQLVFGESFEEPAGDDGVR